MSTVFLSKVYSGIHIKHVRNTNINIRINSNGSSEENIFGGRTLFAERLFVQFSTTFKMSDIILRYNQKLMIPVSDTVCVCRYVMCVYIA